MDENLEVDEVPEMANTEDNDDKEFDPPIEMMIHDYDDERTLDDEEALEEEAEEVLDELSELQKDNEIPLAELFAMHGYGEVHPINVENDIEAIIEDDCSSVVEETISIKTTSIKTSITSTHVLQMYVEDEEDLYTSLEFSNSGMYKTTRVGEEYQAQVPEIACSMDTVDPNYGAPDTLLWDPSHLSENQVEAFNKATEKLLQETGENWVKDNDEFLYSLMQSNFNIEEALRRHSFNTIQPVDTMSLWTEQEVDRFENGLCTYGKDFFKIHQNKLPSKSVMDIIKFYYLYKKTPRHETLVTRTDVKIGKKTRPFKISSNRNLEFLENLLGDGSGKSMAAEA
ncbi:mesoderm induction early response protein 1-like [Neocloeon triangulifer]|uniref:mesoderm induction early response protein 1-like n=1 Tax=Neocloeon triangulifer TaxID=2078957 RepID=UPI00286F41B6|nr:mesoderm induction early response protein 1-like [Neocloeon triangulifer]